MNQKKSGNLWHRLPIRTKLLSPILLALAVALIVIAVVVQAPIDNLAQGTVQQAFSVQADVYHSRLQSALTAYERDVASLVESDPAKQLAAAYDGKDDQQISQAEIALELHFQDALLTQLPYDDLRYLASNGDPLAMVTTLRNGNTVIPNIGVPKSPHSEGGSIYFHGIITQLPGRGYVLPVATRSPDAADTQPVIQVGVPIYLNGKAVGAIVASYQSSKFLKSMLDTTTTDPYQAFLVESNGTLLAATNPDNGQAVSILGQDSLPAVQMPKQILDGSDHGLVTIDDTLYTTSTINAPSIPVNNWTIVISQARDVAFAGANSIKTTLYITFALLFVVITGAMLYYFHRTLSQPLAEVNRVASRMAQGNLETSIPTPSTGGDEIGQLASAFNNMSRQLSDQVTSLESRVTERTRNIEISAEISRDAAGLRDIKELLWRAVNAIRDRFDFYHVQVFLLDDAEEFAVLVTSTGEAGQTLLARNHKLAVGSDSLIGQTTAKARAFITLDTQKSDVPHRFNPILPETRSELAVPLQVSGTVIGALDVQSVQPDAFTEDDAQIFAVLADQLAIAIDNARLLEESNSRLQQVDDLNRQLTRSSWEEFISEEKSADLGFSYDLRSVEPFGADDNTVGKHADIKVRGESVGSLSVQADQLSDEDTAILQAVADRVALAIENTRLVQQTRSALTKVEQLYQANRTLTNTNDLGEVYEIAASQLRSFEFMDRIIFSMAAPTPVPDSPYFHIDYAWERHPSENNPFKRGTQLSRQQFPPAGFVSLDRRAIVFDIENQIVKFPMLYNSLKALGVQSGVAALLATNNRWFGILVLHSNRPHAFNESFLQFLSAFSDQITTTLENQYLLSGLQLEARRNRALAEAAQISSQIGIDFETGITNLFNAVAGPADYDRWWFGQLVDVGGESALVRVHSHFGEGSPLHLMARINLDSEANTIAEAARLRQWVLVNDPTEHHALNGLGREKMVAFGKHIVVPVEVASVVVGALMLGRELDKSDLDDRDVQLALTLANQVSVVLENRRLFASAETERQTLQAVLDSLPTGVLVVDAKSGDISLTNELARSLLGLDEEHPFARLRTLDNAPYDEDEFAPMRVLKTLEPVVSEDMTVVRSDGERLELLVNAAPVMDHNGELISAVAVFQDVSDLRELENVLQDSLRETTSLYETTRAISAETDLVGILNVVTTQIVASLDPNCIYAMFSDDDGNIVQTFGADLVNNMGISELTGIIPVPMSVLINGDVFSEGDIPSNPELSSDPQLQALGIDSVSTFPFNVRSRTVGWLVLGFTESRFLSPEERRLVGTLSDQAAVAAENARLAEQTAQALSETTLLYEASYTINRATSIEDALGIMRDQMKYFAPTQIDIFLGITRFDTTVNDWAVHWSANDPSSRSEIVLSGTRTVNDEIIQADPFFVDNVATATPEQLQLMHMMPELENFRAQAAVSLTVGGNAIGRLVVSFNRPYRFGRLERQFITTLIDQAAIVINNNMLVQQTQDSLDETATLYQSSRAIADASDMPQVLAAIIEYAAPPNINRATLIRLTTPTWDAPDAAIEILADWDKDSETNRTGERLTPDQYAAWEQISSPEIEWIEDVATALTLNGASREMYQSMGAASVVNIPLATGGQIIGSLVFSSPEPWPRLERETRIFSSLADQAAISIVNRSLLRQTERRARQLQISAQIAQAATSILDLDELFNRSVYLVRDGFGYDHAQIFLITPDGTDAQLVASTGEAGRQLLDIHHHLLVGSSSVIGRVTAEGISQIVGDTADPRAVHKPNPYLPHTRAEMALPMKARNRILGALDVQSNTAGAFTEEDVRVLSNLADQIAVAIDNARLFEVSEQRVDEMRFLFDVTRTATVAEESEVALRNIADLIRTNLKAGVAAVLVLNEDSSEFINYQSGDMVVPTQLYQLDSPIFRRIKADHQPFLTNEATTSGPGFDIKSAVIVPLLSGDNLIGAIAAGKTETHGFTDDSVRLLQTMSSSLAAIIQNARLLNEVQTANIRLREVDKLKSQFLANMSHELRTPLNSIIGFSRVILKGIDGPLSEMQEQDLSTIHESGKHLLNLVNDILDQAKIEAGKMELSYGYFSMGELVKSVMSTAVGLVKDKPVRLHQEIENELPQVWGDEFRSRQVLLNLVSNASKFTAQGSVTVSAFKIHEGDVDMVQISVTDTGIGIPQDKLGAVFEAFQQAENTTARQYEGTGLGLPIAKSLIEMQGGRIFVNSEVGIGSTFSFTIPTVAPEPAEEPEQPLDTQLVTQVTEAIEKADEGPKVVHRIILAIDDELGMVNLYRRYLSGAGYEVIGGSPEEAEELAIAYSPRLILLDINMPKRSGWDVLAHLKDRDETFEIPVIVCSIEAEKERAFRLGAADYLLKSIDEQTLVAAVKRVELERDRRKVLIIDDQPDSIRLVHDAISADERFVIIEALGGEQGLDMINNHWPDLIILDLRMPGMDGFEVLQHLHDIPDAQNIPVIVVTADDLTEEERNRLGDACLYQKQTVDAKDLLDNVVAQLSW